jgi:hypothetical protein
MVLPVGVCLLMRTGALMRMRVGIEKSFFRDIFMYLLGMVLFFLRRRIQMLFGHTDYLSEFLLLN